MDRTCPIYQKISGKPIAGIAVAERGIGQAISNIRAFSKIHDMRWVGSVTALAKTPKDASKNPQIKRRLRILAKKIENVLTVS
jgi:hypothetical protein